MSYSPLVLTIGMGAGVKMLYMVAGWASGAAVIAPLIPPPQGFRRVTDAPGGRLGDPKAAQIT